TKLPLPWMRLMTPMRSSSARARRLVMVDTPNISASRFCEGTFEPGGSVPSCISSRRRFTISWYSALFSRRLTGDGHLSADRVHLGWMVGIIISYWVPGHDHVIGCSRLTL